MTEMRVAGTGTNGFRLRAVDPPDAAGPVLGNLDGLPTVELRIAALSLDRLVRHEGESDEHVRTLAEAEDELPPIVVHHPSMTVLDGLHRVRVALLRGREMIRAKLYQGSNEDAFVLAVRMNVTHGLPLSRTDRMAAAGRIIGSHLHWSNRMIATATGLSAGTIGEIRRRSTVQPGQSIARIGRDGRSRPIDGSVGRLKAADLLAKNPTASLRAIAREAGVSPSTVQDVRKRLQAREDPVPARLRANPADRSRPVRRLPTGTQQLADVDAAATVAALSRDPTLRFSDPGRQLIRWLDRHRVPGTEYRAMTSAVPDHCVDTVARLAYDNARLWAEFGAALEQRRLAQRW